MWVCVILLNLPLMCGGMLVLQVVSSTVSSFVHDMVLRWHLPRDMVQEFINACVTQNKLPVGVWNGLVADLDTYEDALADAGVFVCAFF